MGVKIDEKHSTRSISYCEHSSGSIYGYVLYGVAFNSVTKIMVIPTHTTRTGNIFYSRYMMTMINLAISMSEGHGSFTISRNGYDRQTVRVHRVASTMLLSDLLGQSRSTCETTRGRVAAALASNRSAASRRLHL